MRATSVSETQRHTKYVPQKIPRRGTKLRALWDLLQANKGVIITDPLTTMFQTTYISVLQDFYGLDIRNLGERNEGNNRHGRRKGGSKWILAGEWFGSKYVDYIANNKKKLAEVEALLKDKIESAT